MAATFGPYSPVRKAGNYFFISGQVGVTPEKTASSAIEEQTRQALRNLETVLQSADLSTRSVVKTTIFLTNMNDFATVNEVYMDHFPDPRPARTCVEVSKLPNVADRPLLIEIEAIAYKEAI